MLTFFAIKNSRISQQKYFATLGINLLYMYVCTYFPCLPINSLWEGRETISFYLQQLQTSQLTWTICIYIHVWFVYDITSTYSEEWKHIIILTIFFMWAKNYCWMNLHVYVNITYPLNFVKGSKVTTQAVPVVVGSHRSTVNSCTNPKGQRPTILDNPPSLPPSLPPSHSLMYTEDEHVH